MTNSFGIYLCRGTCRSEEVVGRAIGLSWRSLIAAGRVLPVLLVRLALSAGRQRLRIQDIERLTSTAPIIVTAACSSGIGHFAGLGQRLGLFRALRRRGTRSFIAPRWKSHAPAAGPVLADMMERYVLGGEPLGRALWLACRAAEDAGLPRRHAWNFGLEGDWT
jgi:hypothetical protein